MMSHQSPVWDCLDFGRLMQAYTNYRTQKSLNSGKEKVATKNMATKNIKIKLSNYIIIQQLILYE